ncbi:MAG: thiamine phosphate synthase [Candidatus Glassbacteria bacterium]|nr:thiamine phosphate synthase [Candidatus Glassbacteria bacterium]
MKKSAAVFLDFRLHAVTDSRALASGDFYRRAGLLCSAGPAAIHLRAHGLTGGEFFRYARELRSLTGQAGVPLIVNDRLDVALAVQADAVHLGLRSIPLARAAALCRRRGLLCGFSCHSPEEAARAVRDGADYLYFGTVFPSAGKPSVEPAGTAPLGEIARSTGRPLFAIGGVTPENAPLVARAGAFGCAAVSGLWHCQDPAAAASQYLAAFRD